MARFPNFFLVGAAKSGTTSLYEALGAHPAIFLSPLKEPHFFAGFPPDRRTARLNEIVRDERRYRELFAGARDEPVVGEGSTSYLWDRDAPARIAGAAPGARIVAILRDPVERAYSHHLDNVRQGHERRSFVASVAAELDGSEAPRWPFAYVDLGRYGEQLPRYLDRFERVLVLYFEHFVADPTAETRRVLAFLDVDDDFEPPPVAARNPFAAPRGEAARRLFASPGARVAARAVVPPRLREPARRIVWRRGPKPPLDPEARALLAEAFRPDVARVAAATGAEPPWAGAW